MKIKTHTHKASSRSTRTTALLTVLAVLLVTAFVSSTGFAAVTPVDAKKPAAAESVQITGKDAAATEAMKLAEQWGIEVTSIRLAANQHMIDYRYRVLDPGKASDLFDRQIKPYLIHQESNKVLAVPETAKLGPLRNSNIPQQGKIYWMFFGNAGQLVKSGDKVTVVIGDFKVENLVVQ